MAAEEAIRIRGRFDLPSEGAPLQTIAPGPAVRSVALLGSDYPGLRLKPLVQAGERVSAGRAVLADRSYPDIVEVAPAGGTVREIARGPRRGLEAFVIDIDDRGDAASPPRLQETGTDLRRAMLASGLWTTLRTRPFGRIPAPDALPDAIFVTMVDPGPLAADPSVVLAGREADFAAGADALATLTPGRLYVCHGPATAPPAGRARNARSFCFAGGYAAGLASAHIHELHPVDRSGSVWQIGYREVAALGRLLTDGRLEGERVIALAGPGARNPRLVHVPIGADIADLTRGEEKDGACEAITGTALHGRAAPYLGRLDTQVTLLPRAAPREPLPLLTRIFGIRRPAPLPIMPLANLDGAAVAGVPVVPLLRALAAGDAETAAALGCLALVEEDMAPLSFLCASGAGYGPMLRAVLDELAENR